MAKRSTLQRSGQAMIYNFLINEVLASQLDDAYELWVVTPWITDFRLASPFYVSFKEVVATRHESLHLFDVLYQIAANGGAVRIVVGPDAQFAPLRELVARSDRIAVRVLRQLHAKAYAGRYGALDGSLNLTGAGVNSNAELYSYSYDTRSIAQLRQLCMEHFAGAEAL